MVPGTEDHVKLVGYKKHPLSDYNLNIIIYKMSVWRLFPEHVPGETTLLIKHDVSIRGYTVYVTDLSYIWIQHLCKDDIVKKAESENVSIDLSERSQQQVLLQKLQDALDGKDDTTIAISSDEGGHQLNLDITAKLPAGFKPLTWKFNLLRASQQELASEFILPVLDNLSQTKNEIEYLLKQIADKDHAIEWVRGKIENSGSSFGGVMKTQPLKGYVNIHGLNKFDRQDWQSSAKKSLHGDQDGLSQQLFGHGLNGRRLPSKPVLPPWWTKLSSTGDANSNFQYPHFNSPKLGYTDQSPPRSYSSSRDEGFHHRGKEGFPRPRHGRESDGSSIPNNDQSATDNSGIDDHDDPSTISSHLPSRDEDQARYAPARIGKIGGIKRAATSQQVTDEPRSSDGVSKTPDKVTAGRDPIATGTRPKLGRIGGRSHPPVPSGRTDEHVPLAKSCPSVAGTVTSFSPSNDGMSLKKEFIAAIADEEETEQERADRNRARPKQGLEQKKKVPVKKKRKF